MNPLIKTAASTALNVLISITSEVVENRLSRRLTRNSNDDQPNAKPASPVLNTGRH